MKKINEEVYYLNQDNLVLGSEEIEKLKCLALKNKSKKCRFCTHSDPSSQLHEMFIFHAKTSEVKIHKHLSRDESFLILDGEVNLNIHSEDGSIKTVINLGSFQSGKKFYYKISKNTLHSLSILSNHVIFKETTQGPFRSEDSIFI